MGGRARWLTTVDISGNPKVSINVGRDGSASMSSTIGVAPRQKKNRIDARGLPETTSGLVWECMGGLRVVQITVGDWGATYTCT